MVASPEALSTSSTYSGTHASETLSNANNGHVAAYGIYGLQSTQQLRSYAGVRGPVLGIAWVGGFEGDL